jgi:hypothetical protein
MILTNNRRANTPAYDLFAERLQTLRQLLALCERRATDGDGMTENEQAVIFDHLLEYVEAMGPLYASALDEVIREDQEGKA